MSAHSLGLLTELLFILFLLLGDTTLLEVVCEHVPFNNIRDITDKYGNTPYHLVMEHKCSPTTIKICEILSKWPIDPCLANKRGIRPDEKRISDRRNAILHEAEKNFRSKLPQKKKSKHSKKKRSKYHSKVAKETPDNVSQVMVEEVDNTHDLEFPSSIAELPNNQFAVLIKENIERFQNIQVVILSLLQMLKNIQVLHQVY